MEKTAMQELVEMIENTMVDNFKGLSAYEIDCLERHNKALKLVLFQSKKLLQKEKQQIEEAYKDGANDQKDLKYILVGKNEYAEQHYNNKYKESSSKRSKRNY